MASNLKESNGWVGLLLPSGEEVELLVSVPCGEEDVPKFEFKSKFEIEIEVKIKHEAESELDDEALVEKCVELFTMLTEKPTCDGCSCWSLED